MTESATKEISKMTGEVPTIEFYQEQGQVRVLDVMLEVLPMPDDPMAARFIPKWDLMRNQTCFDEPTLMLLRDMAIALTTQESLRLEGPPGVSKSFGAELICALTNRNFIRHNYSRDSEIGDTIGKFIPADPSISVRLDELLADSDVQAKPDIRTIVELAIEQSRPLSRIESKKIASALGIQGLEDDKAWMWKNGTLTGSMIYGATYLADERNLAPSNVTERENPATEGRRSTMRLVEHEGEIIRPLTPDEQDIIDGGGIIPGVFGLNEQYWFLTAQNPHGIGGGRTEESSASRNRQRDRIVESLKPQDYENYIRFLITGRQPDMVLFNRRYKGETVAHPIFEDLQSMPNVEIFIKWLAKFHTDLDKLAQEGSIGSEKDMKGGSYVYTRRNIDRLLSTIRGLQKGGLLDVDELFQKGKLKTTESMHDIVWEAIRAEYLDSMYQIDREAVEKVIEATGIMDRLGPSINNPVPPEWVSRARNSGLQVTQAQGGWRLSRLELRSLGLDIDSIINNDADLVYDDDEDDGDSFIITQKIGDTYDLYKKLNGDRSTDSTRESNVMARLEENMTPDKLNTDNLNTL